MPVQSGRRSRRRTKSHSFSAYIDRDHTPYSGKVDEELLVLAVNKARSVLSRLNAAGKAGSPSMVMRPNDTQVIREPYVAISREHGYAYDVSDRSTFAPMTADEFKRKYVMRRPDLLFHKGYISSYSEAHKAHCGADDYLGGWLDSELTYIVEFDGGVHHTPAGKKAADRRAADYDMSEITLHIINSADNNWDDQLEAIIEGHIWLEDED